MQESLVNIACSAAWVLVVVPAIVFLFTGWSTRHDHFIGLLSDSDLEFYFSQFRRTEKPMNRVEMRSRFQQYLGVTDGRRHYVIPLLLLGLIALIGLWGTAQSLKVWLHVWPGQAALPAIAVSAFVGALTWVVGDQLSRFRTRDFTPHDVYGCAYRILIAVPLAYSLTAALKTDLGVPFGFLLGVFPTGTLMTMARRLASQRFGLGDTEDKVVNELVQLQGINKSQAERFQAEGITTIVELAWADPIDLTIRTNFELWFVVDCMSQALLWVYLEPKTPEIYKFSLRGAMEAKYLLADLAADDDARKQGALSALSGAAKALAMEPDGLRHTLEEVSRDPYTIFLCSVWDEQVAPALPAH
jgi:hypothetical protein